MDSRDSGEILDAPMVSIDPEPGAGNLSMGVATGQTLTGSLVPSDGGENELLLASSLGILSVDSYSLSGGKGEEIDSWGLGWMTTSWSGDRENILPLPSLKITEVYYDGTDEWIEITNIGGGDFQGNVLLSWIKSTVVRLTGISILSGASTIFGDQCVMCSWVWFIGKTGLALNIADTAAIDILMTISGQAQERFAVDQVQVNGENDKKTSFELIDGSIVPVISGRVVNALSGYHINPGTYGSIPPKIDEKILSGESSSGNMEKSLLCDSGDQKELIKINEIFAWNEKYPSYIEILVQEEIALTRLSISGSLVKTPVGFSFEGSGKTLAKDSLFLVAATGFRNDEGIESVRNRDFYLVSTWKNLLITIGYWQSWQVMDIVSLSGIIIGKSSYFTSKSGGCERILDAVDDFSPGFDRKFLKYIPVITVTNIVTIITGSLSGSSQDCQLPEPEPLLSWVIVTGNIPRSITGEYTIRILDIEYDPEGSDTNNEKITLLATHSSGDQTPLDLSKTFRLKVNGTNKTLPRTLSMDTPTTFTKTFGFPNSTEDGQPVIVTLNYGEYIFDTYSYNPNIPKEDPIIKEKEVLAITGEELLPQTKINLSGLQFIISWVLPNPVGSDKNEELGLVIKGDQGTGDREQGIGDREQGTDPRNQIPGTRSQEPDPSIQIPGPRSQYPDPRNQIPGTRSQGIGLDLSQGFSLRIGSHAKKLSWIVYMGQENILSWSLGLVNKAACVALRYEEQELTKFCYGPPKEGQRISASFSGLASVAEENIDILNTLSLKRIANQLCVRYKEQSFLCKRIPASQAEIKVVQEQRLYRWFTSIIKQYIIDNRQLLYYDTSIKKYFDMLTQNKKLIGLGYDQVDMYGQTLPITDLKQQIMVMESTLPAVVAVFVGAEAMYSD